VDEAMSKRLLYILLILTILTMIGCETDKVADTGEAEASNITSEAVEGTTLTVDEALIGASEAVEGSFKELEEPILTYEAEEGILNGVEVDSETEGFSGEGYVTGFDEEKDSVVLTIEAPTEGMHHVWIGYNAPYGEKVTELSINDQPFGEIVLAQTTDFTELNAGKVLLNEGSNEITLLSDWGWYDIDYVKIQKAEPRAEHQIEAKLVNPNASQEAVELHHLLVKQYGKAIFAGQQTLNNALELGSNYGKMPAIVGFDLMDYSPTRVEYGSTSDEIENMIKWHEMGGIVALQWHWNAPADLIDSEEQPWWRGFYTEATTFDIAEVLEDPQSENYKLMISDIDAIAEKLKILQEHNIPVLWRPIHEADGGWFWWGAKGPDPAKELWRILYDRLTNYHHLNNLIWVWNSEAPEWYPGNDIVDIVSVDIYSKPGDYNPVNSHYENLVELVNDKKLVALAENGPIPDPDLLQMFETHWSWFNTWIDDYIRDENQNSKEHLKHLLNHDYVITLDELEQLRHHSEN